MKRFLLIVLTIVVLAAVSATVLPISTCAEKGNYLNEKWQKGLASSITENTENGEEYVSAPVSGAWTSPMIDILPTMKFLVSQRKWIKVTVSFDVRVSSENTAQTFVVRPLIRAAQNDSSVTDAEWNAAYKKAVGEKFVLFSKGSGNVTWYFGSPLTVNANEWTHFEKTVTLTKQQINDTMTKQWNLCVDNISNISDITTLDFKNAQVAFEKVKGDVNNDGALNSLDRIALSRFLLGWDVIIDETEADINGDGKINTIDRIIISRYFSGWEGYNKYFG